MAIYRAKSFFILVLSGLLFTSLPLIIVLGGSEVLMGRLARHSSQSVYRAVEGSRLSQDLADMLVDQERTARQYYVLADEHLLQDFERQHGVIQETLAKLRQMPYEDEQHNKIALLTKRENALSNLMGRGIDHQELADGVLRDFVKLNDLGREIMKASSEQTTREADALQKEAAQARGILFWLAAALIPLSGLFIAFFARLILRPIKQIDHGINQLGKGDFASSIEVHGPDDLVFLGRRLDWLRRNLADFEKNKGKFAAHISHELKTPLASIKEGTELLADEIPGPITSQQMEIINILRKNSTQLQSLIENLLGYTMARARHTELNLEPVMMESLIDDVLTAHRPSILKNDLNIEAEIAPLSVSADRNRLTTIIDNVLSNALKYSPPAGRVSLRLTEKAGCMVLDIKDNGPGIPEMERDAIFQPFVQGSTTCRSAVKGSGLGLAIAREYATAHGGDIALITDGGEDGACFRLTMPMQRGDLL
jgi:two-component system sensor histidine kinase GlrK